MVRNTFENNPAREIEKIGNYWCPKGRADAWPAYYKRAPDMDYAIKRCAVRRLAVQAGGNIGAWPVYLSRKFSEVMTFEPEDMNYRCLIRNVQPHTNIEPYFAALGSEESTAKLKIAGSLGGHHLTLEPGETKVIALDTFQLPHLDYIMLDIEGFEYEALKGAIETIKRHRPVIQIEDRGHGVKKGTGKTLSDITALLKGYKATKRVHRDVVLEWSR